MCKKRVWLQTFRPELAKDSLISGLATDAGIELGRLARLNYPGGAVGSHVRDPLKAVEETATLVACNKSAPLFEAAFLHEDVIVRTDILAPIAGGWRLIAVKTSGSVKDHHVVDLAIQVYVLENAGITVSQVCVAHVDTRFEYMGDGNYRGLIMETDVNERVTALLPQVPAWIATHLSILDGPMPSVRIGAQCENHCQFFEFCQQGQPEYPVSILPNGRKLIGELLSEGIEDVRDVPAGRLTNGKHIRVWQSTVAGQPYVSPDIEKKLSKLAYPRFYVDFEAINLAVPRWKGTRPHQQLPFQWSCHIERHDGALEHREFLDTSGHYPMRSFVESLMQAVERDGPVLVYGNFERQILATLIGFCPDFGGEIVDLMGRLVNLHPLLQEHYYHPGMKGSWSIKAVLPTVAPHLDYGKLEGVRNGALAQAAYLDIIDTKDDPATLRRKAVNLLKYCELDTLAMVEVVRAFA